MTPASASPSNGATPLVQRDAHGRFLKGAPIINGGRPKGVQDKRTQINRVVEAFEQARASDGLPCRCQPRCHSFDEHTLKRALVNDQLLVALLNKRYPTALESDAPAPGTGERRLLFMVNIDGKTAVAMGVDGQRP